MADSNKDTIDLIGILKLLWGKRKRLILNCFYAGVLAIVIAYSIPKEYTSEVIVAPEFASSTSLGGSIGSLASLAGVNLDLSDGGDALYPELYPQLVESTPFLCELMSMQVDGQFKGDSIHTTLYSYLQNNQRVTWWDWILGTPNRIKAKRNATAQDNIVPESDSDSRFLSRRQQLTLKALKKKTSVVLDKNTSAISIKVTMQDPRIAADVAEQVSANLQKYICNYRSAKARQDLESMQVVFDDAKAKYYEAQSRYAKYSDQHLNISRMSNQIELDRLSNEQDLAFNVYNQLASQMEMARAKVLEQTPVCVTIQPALVPYKASSPKKMLIGLLYVFLAFFGTAAWYILKECSQPK